MPGESLNPARLRVVSWNIRAAIGPGEPFPPAWWRHVRHDRLEQIGAFLVALDPDIATLQEVTIMTPHGDVHDQPAELGRLTDRHVRYGAVHTFPLVEPETGRAVGMASWGNVILSRRPLADGFAIGLPRAADDDLLEPAGSDHPLAGTRYRDTEPGHRESRCVVGGTVVGGSVVGGSVVGPGGFTVATAHLTYIGREQRRGQADALATIVRAAPIPAILTGDFNAPLDAPELAALVDGLTDAFAAVGVPVDDPRRRSCGRSTIDHILVRGMEVETCRVATESGDASDHWPVVADLWCESN